MNIKQDVNQGPDIILCANELAEIRDVPQFLFSSVISADSTIAVRAAIIEYLEKGSSSQEVDFILNSPGGSAHDAYRIIRTLRKNFNRVNIVVPFWAKSAATLLALGGNNIIMDAFAEFGPLDIQLAKEREDSPNIERESALNDEYSLKRLESRSVEQFEAMFVQVYENKKIPVHKHELTKRIFGFLGEFYKPLLKQINPYKLGEKKRKLEIGEQYARKILALFNPQIDEESRNSLINYLVHYCPDHSYVIDYELISLFIPDIVKQSSIFGKDYEKQLSVLTGLFLEIGEEFEYIGFIKIPDPSKDIEPPIAQSVENSNHGSAQALTKENNQNPKKDHETQGKK